MQNQLDLTDIIDQNIIFEDSDIIAINKPYNICSIPGGFSPNNPNLYHLLKNKYNDIWIVHRLDKLTSGIILFAKNKISHKLLNEQFQNRMIQKSYHAIIHGTPNWESKKVSLPLRKNADRKHRTIVDLKNGKPALTLFSINERFDNYSLIEAKPKTGYTHQIRAHLSNINYPIVQDPLYKYIHVPPNALPIDGSHLPINRLALHAFSIFFLHPILRTKLKLEAPYPEDFQITINLLRKKD